MEHNLPFIVTKTPSMPILGVKSSKTLNLVKRIHGVTQELPEFLNEYNSCFGDPNIQPVIHAPRRIPMTIQVKLKVELDKMVKMDVIEPVHEPTDWVSSLVIVEKPNGKLRICLDPQDLNKAIKRHHYKLPSAEEVFSQMSGAKYFTKLNPSNGYWQIKVDNDSSKLLTFATLYGR